MAGADVSGGPVGGGCYQERIRFTIIMRRFNYGFH